MTENRQKESVKESFVSALKRMENPRSKVEKQKSCETKKEKTYEDEREKEGTKEIKQKRKNL